jgi:hypothetical protein
MGEVNLYGGDDDPRFHVKQIEADQRNSHPRIDDNALVQHPIKHVYEAVLGRRRFQSHVCLPKILYKPRCVGVLLLWTQDAQQKKKRKFTSRYASEFFSGGFPLSAKKNFVTAPDLLNIRQLRADVRCPSKCRRLLRKLSGNVIQNHTRKQSAPPSRSHDIEV